jgi:hypothetical protein
VHSSLLVSCLSKRKGVVRSGGTLFVASLCRRQEEGTQLVLRPVVPVACDHQDPTPLCGKRAHMLTLLPIALVAWHRVDPTHTHTYSDSERVLTMQYTYSCSHRAQHAWHTTHISHHISHHSRVRITTHPHTHAHPRHIESLVVILSRPNRHVSAVGTCAWNIVDIKANIGGYLTFASVRARIVFCPPLPLCCCCCCYNCRWCCCCCVFAVIEQNTSETRHISKRTVRGKRLCQLITWRWQRCGPPATWRQLLGLILRWSP